MKAQASIFAAVVSLGITFIACDRGLPPSPAASGRGRIMRPLPNTKDPLVLLTDFTNPGGWEAVRSIIRTPVDGFDAYVQYLDDPAYAGVTADDLKVGVGSAYRHGFLFVVDHEALSRGDHALLVVGLREYHPRRFRATPDMVQSIQNNVSLGNIGLEEFEGALDETGTFRGFPNPH